MKELEGYLRKATKGLWGQKRFEVWRELEANINLRVQEILTQGKSHQQALGQALEELGKAETLGAGMRGVHALPRLLRSTSVLLLLGLSVLMLIPSQAQLIPTVWKEYRLVERPLLVEAGALEAELAKQGIQFRLLPIDRNRSGEVYWVVYAPQNQETKALTESLTKQGIKFRLAQTNSTDPQPSEIFILDEGLWVGSTIQLEGQSYISLDTLIEIALRNNGKIGQLEGWDVLKFGFPNTAKGTNTLLTFGTPQDPINPYLTYSHLLWQRLWPALGLKPVFGKSVVTARNDELPRRCTHLVKVTAPPGTIMAMIGRYIGDDYAVDYSRRVIDVAPVGADQTVRFTFPHPRLQFVGRLNDLDQTKVGLRAALLQEVVMVRLSGKIAVDRGADYTIYMPQNKQSTAVDTACN